MSNTEIYGVKNDGEIVFVDETQNSWRGVMHVWSNLGEEYGVPGGPFTGFDGLWKKANKGHLSALDNLMVLATFDNVVVKKETLPVLLDAWKKYDERFPNSSLMEQAKIIEEQVLNNTDLIGICWNQTSVNSNPWEDYDEELDEDIPYNILEGDRHWFLAE